MSNIIELNHFGLFTFNTTSQAIKAEKILKASQAEILVVPTLREISASCGLSIKFRLEHGSEFYYDLKNNKVIVDGIYEVQKLGKGHRLTKLEAL